MASSLVFINGKGEILIYRRYRDDVSRAETLNFCNKIVATKEVQETPIINIDSVSFIHTTHGDIFPIHGATLVPLNHRGGMRAFPVEERSKPSPEWNHYRITADRGVIEPPFFVQSVFGILGGIGAHAEDVAHMRRTADRLFGDAYRWSVLGAGASQMRVAAQAAAMGGNSSAADGAASNCRPPWLETTMPSTPTLV